MLLCAVMRVGCSQWFGVHMDDARRHTIPLKAAKEVAVSGAAIDSQRLVKCNMACIRGKPIELVGQNTANHHKESVVNSHHHQNCYNLHQHQHILCVSCKSLWPDLLRRSNKTFYITRRCDVTFHRHVFLADLTSRRLLHILRALDGVVLGAAETSSSSDDELPEDGKADSRFLSS